MMFLTNETFDSAPPRPKPIVLQVSKAEAIRQIQELFLAGRQINSLYLSTRDELKPAEARKAEWIATARELLRKLTADGDAAEFFDNVTIATLESIEPIEALSEQFHYELNQRLERIRAIKQAMENSVDNPSPEKPATPAHPQRTRTRVLSPVSDVDSIEPQQPAAQAQPAAKPATQRTKVLLVLCSRNGTARQAITRFTNQMNLDLEVVDFNPDQPASIADRVYHHRDSKFAIVYWGEPNGKGLPGSAPPERYVGFALGFVLGRLGRGRVFIMGSTTTPPLPGFNRVLVAQLDSSGGWQIQLARRMKSAGLDVDLNLLT